MGRRTRRKGWFPFVYTLLWCCLWAVLFTSKQDRVALYSAPSMNIVKQTELASLSLSQCLTPWLYFTCNPEILETQTPVNHPPQVFTISKPNLYHSFQQLVPFCFLQWDTFHSFTVYCKIV